eukprot:SAG11_NODE_5015_length_1691_cov_0.947236_1_plen_225_part_00
MIASNSNTTQQNITGSVTVACEACEYFSALGLIYFLHQVWWSADLHCCWRCRHFHSLFLCDVWRAPPPPSLYSMKLLCQQSSSSSSNREFGRRCFCRCFCRCVRAVDARTKVAVHRRIFMEPCTVSPRWHLWRIELGSTDGLPPRRTGRCASCPDVASAGTPTIALALLTPALLTPGRPLDPARDFGLIGWASRISMLFLPMLIGQVRTSLARTSLTDWLAWLG